MANSTADSEKFFYKMSQIIQECMLNQGDARRATNIHLQMECCLSSLRILQLLCEGHNL
jgi:hypothetical protein